MFVLSTEVLYLLLQLLYLYLFLFQHLFILFLCLSELFFQLFCVVNCSVHINSLLFKNLTTELKLSLVFTYHHWLLVYFLAQKLYLLALQNDLTLKLLFLLKKWNILKLCLSELPIHLFTLCLELLC